MSFLSAVQLSRVPEEKLSVSKKRKRDGTRSEEKEDIDTRPFVVRPAGNDPFAKTRTFTPICLITRARLPLAWLDTSGSGSQLFAADVRTLEALHDVGEEGRVLVAEEKEGGRLFAVERTARRVYALCRLGAWVGREGIEGLAATKAPSGDDLAKRRTVASAEGVPWWNGATVDVPITRDAKPCARRLLDMSLGGVKEDALAPQKAIQCHRPGTSNADAVPEPAAIENQMPDEPESASTAQDPLEELSRQYLDALYLSRTSLAYFAKGPLSRARAAFTGISGSDTHASNLIALLRETALSSTTMDKKYKDTVPSLVKELCTINAEAASKPSKSKRKKKWKPKRVKAGLFSNELEYLGKWWHDGDRTSIPTSPETIDVAIKRRMPALRSRETYLQIIVILETLVLEASNKDDASNPPQLPAAEESQDAETQDAESQATGIVKKPRSKKPQDAESQATGIVKKPRSKKPQDLHSSLETLLDKLCIWHSLESNTPAKSLGNNGDAAKEDGNDELKSFCVEVIIPFYMSRLPKEAALVNKKLGGPSPPSPAKRKSTSSRSKPGEPAHRAPPPQKQARKPLSRVPTEVLNHPPAPAIPGLYRSATDSQIIKREDSAVSLSSIPPIPAQQSRKRRSDLLSSFSSSFGHREVDLDAKAAAAAAKLKKREEQDAQVRDAILAIKKPNRTLASREVAARADERFAQSLPGKRPRPQLQQAHSLPAAAVHVAATPKRGSKVVHADSYSTVPEAAASVPGSSHSMIPSTSVRYRERPRPQVCAHTISSTPAVPQTSHRAAREVDVNIEDTPSRARAVAEYSNLPAALTESPTAKRRSNVLFATPSKPTASAAAGVVETPNVGYAKAAALVQGTPMLDRLSAVAGTGRAALEHAAVDGQAGGSIYDTLGWNDEEYEELA